MQMPPVEEGAPERSSSEQGGFAGCPAARRSGEPHALKASACTLRESKGTKMPPNGCLCVEKARGGGNGTGAHRLCSSSRKLNEKKQKPPSHPRAHFAKRKNALVQGLGETARRLLGPRQGTTGFFGPAAEAKRQHPPPTYPGNGVGMGIVCLPLTQGSPQSPKTKNTTEQTNKNKNKKHCYHQLI